MSQFRIDKQRARAELTLTNGASLLGSFFLAPSRRTSAGQERVADLLNAEAGFFPFELAGERATVTVLVNRTHLIVVRLMDNRMEVRMDPAYDVAVVRRASLSLANGATLTGSVRVYHPEGRDRLSDFVRSAETFLYIEGDDDTFIVNAAQIVQIEEV